MKRRIHLPTWTAAGGLALVLLGSPAAAQVDLGRIDLTVEDTTGAVLPGAAVTITGPQDRSDVFTDVQGEAHLLRLPVGTYVVSVTLQGFRTFVDTAVQVRAASATPLVAALEVGGVEETVTVSGTAPIIDPRRQSTDTHVTVEELQEIPSARDPWVVLQTVPGVVVDRVNVGGAESGQQSIYVAKGASDDENTWTLDGVVITDMASLSSPTYWDFDQFQGGAHQHGRGGTCGTRPRGAAVDVVLKSGTNQYHGSLRGYFANEGLQRGNLSEGLAESIGGETGKGNRMEQYGRLRLRGRRSARQGPAVGLGIAGGDRHPSADAHRHRRSHHPDQPCAEGAGAGHRRPAPRFQPLQRGEDKAGDATPGRRGRTRPPGTRGAAARACSPARPTGSGAIWWSAPRRPSTTGASS